MYRKYVVAAALIGILALACYAHGTTVRIAYRGGFETLDPVRAGDVLTQSIAGTLFDQLYTYDYLARPLKLRPLAASAMPSVSSDGREITVSIRQGIRFSDHRAFKIRPRELVAEDVVYSVKRFMDPAIASPIYSLIAGKIEGLDEVADRATKQGGRFDYDAQVSGLVAVDRYTVRIRLVRPDPIFIFLLANPDLSIVPREAVEADGKDFARHPTGSGPYVMREFMPGNHLVLERNPEYRSVRWEDIASVESSGPEWAASLRGRRFPLPDRVELTAIAEPTTGVLALERGEIDVLVAPSAAVENNRLKPHIAASGFRLIRGASARIDFFNFNMRDAQIGGTTPANIALRRAIAMSINDDEYVRLFLNGNGHAPKHLIPPGIFGYDAAYLYPIHFEPAAANELLDRFGYSKGNDGYRRRPDGAPLTLTYMVGTSSRSRQWSEFLKRSFDRIGVRLHFDAVAGSEQIARMATCHYQMMDGGWLFDWPDGSNLMLAFYGRSTGTASQGCMQDREFDALYDRLVVTPMGNDRTPLYRRMFARLDALTPIRLIPVPDDMYLVAPHIEGLVIHPAFGDNFAVFPYLDVAKNAK